ncbi:MAG: putative DNA binding domain-containing protein [Christensenellaceae bacterium]|jgi:ATP-dependent DNA helicase RecG|nr:putative DNA binding domain-containing protein [Christensenellaceae bacterium]
MLEYEILEVIKKVQAVKSESQTIEVKAAHEGAPEKLYDTLSSFSNQDDGGIILFGLDERKSFEIVGVADSAELIKSIEEQCSQMSPIVRPLITTVSLNGNTVVAAEIPSVDIVECPVFYKGKGRIKGSYVRVGQADMPMTEYEVFSYDAYRKHEPDDIRTISGKSINDLDPAKTAALLEKARIKKPRLASLPDDEVLELIGITNKGELTLTGLLMFGKYPQREFPQFSITAVVVPGMEYGETASDGARFTANKRMDGTVDEMLMDAITFISHNMRVKTIIDNGKRKDIGEYPINSVREAVLNALMHRDYSFHAEGAPIQIRMFYDRLEIISPGGLYGRLTISDLGKVKADTRNKTLARVLEDVGLSENRYSGIPTIRREFSEYGLPSPLFETVRGDFLLTFYNEQSKVNEGKSINERIMGYCEIPRSRGEIAKFIGRTQYYAVKTYIEPLVSAGKLIMSIPSVPASPKQTYKAVQ